jgi:uncharacterized protein (DUF302 family)
MKGVRILLVVLIISLFLPTGAWSSDVRTHGQPMVVNSHNIFSVTIGKLKAALKARDLAIIFETYHKEVMALAGIRGKNGVTIGFVDVKMKHDILGAEPRAALEMPLRIAVRESDDGTVDIIYYQPSYLFKHYQNKDLDKLSGKMDILVGSIILEATGWPKGVEKRH